MIEQFFGVVITYFSSFVKCLSGKRLISFDLLACGPNLLAAVFGKNVFLEHSFTVCLCVVGGCFHARQAELSSCGRDCMPQNETLLLSEFLQKKFADPCSVPMAFTLFSIVS